jgi:putative aminopeptidase FrvX
MGKADEIPFASVNPSTASLSLDDDAWTLLERLVRTPSPSGNERNVATQFRDFCLQHAHAVRTDVLGNVIASLNPEASTRIMYAGHMDEVGFIVHHIDEDGYLHFSSIGGTDAATEVGQRVLVHGASSVPGVVGRKAIQLLAGTEMSQAPSLSNLWIDIGASGREEALELVSVGSTITLDADVGSLHGARVVGRAFDNKVGLFIGAQILARLAAEPHDPLIGIDVLGTVQEEIGSRGAQTSAFGLNPAVAMIVDMGVATDYPGARHEDQGALKLGSGPAIVLGPNANPLLTDRLRTCARRLEIPHQLQAMGSSSPTDARLIQTSRSGVATASLAIPLRYMHTPSEVLDLRDVAATIDLVVAWCRTIQPDESYEPW